jgi:hypothetical protein
MTGCSNTTRYARRSDPCLPPRCVGAAIGIIGEAGLQRLTPLDRPHKVEGLAVQGGARDLLLVTDADDAGIPATLFAATL